MSNSIERGKSHAPGVQCIVNVPKRFKESVDNRKIGTLRKTIDDNTVYTCVCGVKSTCVGKTYKWGVIWEVEGEDLMASHISCKSSISTFPQNFLIPIGDSSLLLPEINEVIKEQTKEIIKPYREPFEKIFTEPLPRN